MEFAKKITPVIERAGGRVLVKQAVNQILIEDNAWYVFRCKSKGISIFIQLLPFELVFRIYVLAESRKY